jgi:predicted nucleic acid-binding protein
VTLFVDTGVWSLAFRRGAMSPIPKVLALHQAINGGEMIVTTGLALQQLLQGFSGPRSSEDIIDRFGAIPFLNPDRRDHIAATQLRNQCRRAGIQPGTIDALLAQLCLRHRLVP